MQQNLLQIALIKAIVAFALLLSIAFNIGCKHEMQRTANERHEFYNGETLYPDYAHTDTLIVTNADLLNELMKDKQAVTDEEISNTLLKTTKKLANPRDYQIELFYDTVWVYDGSRLVGRYTSNWTNQIDIIIINDNL